MDKKKILIALVLFVILSLGIGFFIVSDIAICESIDIENEQDINDKSHVDIVVKNTTWGQGEIVIHEELLLSEDSARFAEYDWDSVGGDSSQNILKETYASYFTFDLPDNLEIVMDYYSKSQLDERAIENAFKPYPCNIYKIYNMDHSAYLMLKDICTSWADKGINSDINIINDLVELDTNHFVPSLNGGEKIILRTADDLIVGDNETFKYISSYKDGSGAYISPHNYLCYWNGPEGPFGLSLEVFIVEESGKDITSEDLEIFDRIVESFRYEKSELIDAYFAD